MIEQPLITTHEFHLFQRFIYDHAGIKLSDEKQTLVSSRLAKRLRHHQCQSFSDYFDLVLTSPCGEFQVAIDLLTTNETYFFREPKHFAFLEHELLPQWPHSKNLKIWSAASSSGEEAYSIAMLLDDTLANGSWEIFGSDISTRVLQRAQQALYKQERLEGIPPAYLKKYCLKGKGDYEHTMLICKTLRQRVNFAQVNLTHPLVNVGQFQVIFLRNVLIYFDFETKKRIIQQIVGQLNEGGYLFIGHSETLKDLRVGLTMIAPAIYQKISRC